MTEQQVVGNTRVSSMLDCSVVEQDDLPSRDKPSKLTGEIAARLRDLRRQQGMSARELAERCAEAGVPSLTRSTIAKIESGVREFVTVDELSGLAQALGLSPEELLQRRPSTQARHLVWGREVPFRNPHFVGRQQELSELRFYLSRESTTLIGQPIQAVYGLGGIGKTELAAEYAHRFRDDYDLIWWIRADQEESINAALVSLGRRLGLEQASYDERDRSTGAILDALMSGDPVDRWLLIFDDAQDASVISRFIPQARTHGHVIITSRNIRWQQLRIDAIELKEFASAQSIEFLRRRVPALAPEYVSSGTGNYAGEQNREEEHRNTMAAALAAELGNLPLALEHAAAYLNETGVSPEQYLEMFRRDAHSLLASDVDIPYPRVAAATWSVSTNALSPQALAVFQLLAFFGPEPVSEELLRQPANAAISETLGNVLGDVSGLRSAIRELARYSLARPDRVRNYVQMHRVVQTVTRDALLRESPAKAEELREVVYQLLAASDPQAPDWSKSGPAYDRSRPHIISSGALDSSSPGVRHLIVNQVRHLHRKGAATESLALGELALRRWRGLFDPDDRLTLALAVEVGMALRLTERWREAFRLNSVTLSELSRHYGKFDELYLRCARSCARDLSMDGRDNEALEFDMDILPDYERAFGSASEDILDLRSDIAISMRCLGRFSDALTLDQEVLSERQHALGLTDARTLTSQLAAANDLRRLGRYEEALDLVRRVNDMLENPEKPWDLLRLMVGAELGLCLRRVGEYEEARRQGEMVLDRHHDLVGRDHPSSLLAATYLVNDRRLTGDLDKAAELGEQVSTAWANLAGSGHPCTCAARVNLAVVMRLQRQLPRARELNDASLADLTRLYGEDHPSTLAAKTNLASDYATIGDVQRALSLGEEALSASQRTRGQDHPSTLATAANLAMDYNTVGNNGGASELLATTLPALERALGKGHPLVRDASHARRINLEINPNPTW
jgi:transcriptional regulator with XRE-family HTH domain/tetratricopeptide (TPR) repeat protein